MQLQKNQTKIYEIRGQKVLFDFYLAELYEVETRVLNQAVKRNMDMRQNSDQLRLLHCYKLKATI